MFHTEGGWKDSRELARRLHWPLAYDAVFCLLTSIILNDWEFFKNLGLSYHSGVSQNKARREFPSHIFGLRLWPRFQYPCLCEELFHFLLLYNQTQYCCKYTDSQSRKYLLRDMVYCRFFSLYSVCCAGRWKHLGNRNRGSVLIHDETAIDNGDELDSLQSLGSWANTTMLFLGMRAIGCGTA